MKDINQETRAYLDLYLSDRFESNYAVMLTGEWGSGKTWFIKNYAEEYTKRKHQEATQLQDNQQKLQQGRLKKLLTWFTMQKPAENPSSPTEPQALPENRFIHVSLFGVKGIDEIEFQIFRQLHPRLSSPIIQSATSIFRTLLSATFKPELGDLGESEIKIQPEKLGIPKFLMNIEKKILIFDDFERASMPITQVMGYLNSLVEIERRKVIILVSENDLPELQKLQGFRPTIYKKIKEKFIGKSFQIKHSVSHVFDVFIGNLLNKNHTIAFSNLKTKIIQVYEDSDYQNLRILQQGLWDFDLILANIDDKYKTNYDLLEALAGTFFIYSIELKKELLSIDDISRLQNHLNRRHLEIGLKPKQSDVPSNVTKFFNKYPELQITEKLLTDKLWAQCLLSGNLSRQEWLQQFDASSFNAEERKSLWQKLFHFQIFEQSKFEKLFTELTSLWENRLEREPHAILQYCALMIRLHESGLYDSKDIVTECKSYIDDVAVSREWDRISIYLGDNIDRDQYQGYGYPGAESPDFQILYDYLKSQLGSSSLRSLPEVAKSILYELEHKPQDFFNRLIGTNYLDAAYVELPVFRDIVPSDFLKVLLKVPKEMYRYMGMIFAGRYAKRNFFSVLKNEEPFIKGLKTLIENEIKNTKSQLIGHQLSHFLLPNIEIALKNLENVPSTEIAL